MILKRVAFMSNTDSATSLEIDSILNQASDDAGGLTDFGQLPFKEPLAKVLASLEEEARLKIIKIHTKEMSVSRGINYRKIAAETEGLSGADLRALCVEAGMNAINDKQSKISSKNFFDALEKVQNRLTDAEISEPEGGLYY